MKHLSVLKGWLCAALCLAAVMACPAYRNSRAFTVSAQAEEVKNGLKKEKGKYYFYKKGKKLKNTWKTISQGKKKSRYYFGKNGAAYAGKVQNKILIPSVRTIKGSKYAFDQKGRMLTGILVIKNRFYYFASNGKLNNKRTASLRKASAYNADGKALTALLKEYGAKQKKIRDFGFSCHGDGTDLNIEYAGFTVQVYQDTAGKWAVQIIIAA